MHQAEWWPMLSLQTGEPPPVDRTKDPVYRSTTNVVRAVMDMSKGVHQAKADQYVELVKVSKLSS